MADPFAQIYGSLSHSHNFTWAPRTGEHDFQCYLPVETFRFFLRVSWNFISVFSNRSPSQAQLAHTLNKIPIVRTRDPRTWENRVETRCGSTKGLRLQQPVAWTAAYFSSCSEAQGKMLWVFRTGG